MDYIERTKQAYEVDPSKYEKSTRDICAVEEADRFASLVPPGQGLIVDAGCAFGRDVRLLADRGLNVLGVDTSSRLLQRAGEIYPDLRFERMDIQHLTFGDGAVAGIWCHATLLHFKDDDLEKVLAEFWRVLAPGGILFATFKEGEGEEEVVESFTNDNIRFYKYQTQESVRRLLESARFNLVDVYRVNEGERWPGKRDLNWVYCFADKSSAA